MNRRLIAIIQREDDGFVALCPELDIASQDDTIESACAHLQEAVELFFECASPTEIEERTSGEVLITQRDVSVGLTAHRVGSRGLCDS